MQTHSCLIVNNQPGHVKVAGISLPQMVSTLFRETGTRKSPFGVRLFRGIQATLYVLKLGSSSTVVFKLNGGLFSLGHNSGSSRMNSLLFMNVLSFHFKGMFLKLRIKTLCRSLTAWDGSLFEIVHFLIGQHFNTWIFLSHAAAVLEIHNLVTLQAKDFH